MNVITFLKPKDTIKYLYDYNTLRQGIEKLHAHSYTALPVISEQGTYVGTVSEGDFLYHLLEQGRGGMKEQENHLVKDIIRKDFNPAVNIEVSMDELIERSLNQNFVPVCDGRGTFIGIVTRQKIIEFFIDMQKAPES